MAVDFSGTWKHEKNEGFEEFLKAMKVGLLPRSMALKQSPTVVITQNGDDFTITTKGARTVEIKFKVGQEYKENNALEGKEFRMVANWDGSKLVTKNLDKPDGALTIREIEGGKFVQTQKLGDITCRRIFKKT
ncbi:sodium/calcium exchanger regulatory protein 1-like [Amphiura filiformis]|uniref:sodium/calcium exchanger regulatory protein 1-like n=1 Tax=Amphiura filiformis TaxID=82378 RepID=UPI003B226C3B